MSEHKARVFWDKTSPDFAKGRYSREHTWEFDGGVTVPASPSPSVVPVPFSNPDNVDPEEAYVAAIASCHMLTFLYLAANAGFHIESYEDRAVGRMTENAKGVPWMSQISLRPRIAFRGANVPTAQELQDLHHGAHEQCYIANSVKTEIIVSTPVDA
jgi:organic hydroperoxide reductase OsmC/OhrA